jgi:hypothetical protein
MRLRREERLGCEPPRVLPDAREGIVSHRAGPVDGCLEESEPGFGALGRFTCIDEADPVDASHEILPMGAGAALRAKRNERSMARAWRK